jgi:hypothetical protein
VRPLAIAIAAAAILVLVISACGGGARPGAARAVHLNGQATGNYVSEISASGSTFLLPAADVAQQGSHTFEVVDAANTNPANGSPIGPSSAVSRYPTGVAEATTVVPRDAHIELLATGAPGLQFLLQWTDTCGRNGGNGQLMLRSPAVVNLTLPHSTAINTCYIAATGFARQMSTLHLAILDR